MINSNEKEQTENLHTEVDNLLKGDDDLLTGGIILDEDLKEIVLIKGRRSGKWGLPKGHLEPGETYLEGALREIKEETGLDIQLMVNVLPCILSKRAKLFLFSLPKEHCTFQIKDHEEILEVTWYPIKDLPSLRNQTHMLKNVAFRMDSIIAKIQKNKKNYILQGDFERPLVLNNHLLQYMLEHSKKSINHILSLIQQDFPKLFYRPELADSILDLRYKMGQDVVDKTPNPDLIGWKVSVKSGKWICVI